MNPTQRLGTGRSSTFVDSGGGGGVAVGIVEGRLTVVSGVPVPSADQVGAGTIYFTPYNGDQIALWNGAAWIVLTFTEASLVLGGLTANKNYDVFGYDNAGVLTLVLSSAWTNDTTRADALALVDGVRVLGSDNTRLFLGTIRATAAATTEDSQLNRLVSNWYNRVIRFMYERCGYVDNNALTEYSITAGQTSWAKVSAIVGSGQSTLKFLSNGEDAIPYSASFQMLASGPSPTYTPSSGLPCCCIGVDSTTQADVGKIGSPGTGPLLNTSQNLEVSKEGTLLSEGFHTFDPLVATFNYGGAGELLLRVDSGRMAGDAADVPTTHASALPRM